MLTESEQMRKESDDAGPKVELEHWKKRLAKFDSLTACVKDPQCRTVISLLVASKSKVLKVCPSHTYPSISSHMLLFVRHGVNWTCLSLTIQMKQKTMSSFSIHWKSTVSRSTSAIQ